jgi:hypothetical protein
MFLLLIVSHSQKEWLYEYQQALYRQVGGSRGCGGRGFGGHRLGVADGADRYEGYNDRVNHGADFGGNGGYW